MLKKWLKSKTLIFNTIALIVAIAMILLEMDLPKKTLEILGAVVAIGNIFLRFLTKIPLYTKRRRRSADNKPIPGDAKEYIEGFKS